MHQHLYILTGASRGMGLAMAQQLLQKGNALLCISRHVNPDLAAAAQKANAALTQWTHDLADGEGASERLREWLQNQNPADFASASLINNAGVIPPIAPLRQSQPADLALALRVGLEAPMALSAAFLGTTENWPMPRKVLNMAGVGTAQQILLEVRFAEVQRGATHDLHVEVALGEHPPGRLAGHREGLGQQVVEPLAVGYPGAELVGLGP
jgi:NAD(P)-dependent dehydrogenase (short-subunit alcohol dehydrogenase family)